jgi:hypothetical protein
MRVVHDRCAGADIMCSLPSAARGPKPEACTLYAVHLCPTREYIMLVHRGMLPCGQHCQDGSNYLVCRSSVAFMAMGAVNLC